MCESKADKEEQERQVIRGKQRIEDLREYGDGWKKKYTDQIETKEQKMEEEIRELEREVKDKVKGIQQVERKRTLLAARVESLEEKLKEVEKELEDLVEERREVCIPLSFVLLLFGSLWYLLLRSTHRQERCIETDVALSVQCVRKLH